MELCSNAEVQSIASSPRGAHDFGSYRGQDVDVEQRAGISLVENQELYNDLESGVVSAQRTSYWKSLESSTTTRCVYGDANLSMKGGTGKTLRKRSDSLEAKADVVVNPSAKLKNFKADDAGNKDWANSHIGDVIKGNEILARSLQGGDRLKVPQAVVAFAQAAAKVNELPGWPLLSPSKPQMQKCEKCPREFCSSLNYRRHIRLHRRPLVDDKDLRNEKFQLAAYWNKLTTDDVSEIVSFKNMAIENLSGISAFQALASFIQQPSLVSFPHAYMKAGSILLELVQCKASIPPMPAEKLLKVLEDASEGTFLCGGTSIAVQRFVYQSDAEKVGLEDKNVVASMSFLVEQKLLKAWMAERDAEALRCEKALVEEEEAAQRKKAKVLERKRQKRIRQKGRKGTDQLPVVDSEPGDEEVNSPRTGEEDEFLLPTASRHDTGAEENGFVVLRSNETWNPDIMDRMQDSAESATGIVDREECFAETQDSAENLVDQKIGRAIKERRRSSNSTTFRTRRDGFDPSSQSYFRSRRTQDSNGGDQQRYRRKLAGMQRGIAKGGTGRAVWARKAIQTSRERDEGSVLVGSLSVPLGEGSSSFPLEEVNWATSHSITDTESKQAVSMVKVPPVKIWKAVGKVGDKPGTASARSVTSDKSDMEFERAAIDLEDSKTAKDSGKSSERNVPDLEEEPCIVDLAGNSASPTSKLLASFLSERWATAIERKDSDSASLRRDKCNKRSKNVKVWPINDQAMDLKMSSSRDGSDMLPAPRDGACILESRPRNFAAVPCGKAVGRWHSNHKEKQRYMPRRQVSSA